MKILFNIFLTFIICITSFQINNSILCNNYNKYLNSYSSELLLLKGTITDEFANPLEAQIIISDNNTNEILMVTYSDPTTGTFSLSLIRNNNYTITIKKEGYYIYSQNYDFNSLINLSKGNNTIILKKDEVKNILKDSNNKVITTPRDYYYIIGASFITLSKAEEVKNQLLEQGFNEAMIINSDRKRYRVAYKSFPTKEEALKELERLKKETNRSDLWILQQ